MAKMKYCSDCDRIRSPKHKFCIKCGNELVSYADFCPKCNYHITEADCGEEAALGCPMCGESLEVEEDE